MDRLGSFTLFPLQKPALHLYRQQGLGRFLQCVVFALFHTYLGLPP
jgi:hypothetical protein